MTSCALWRLYVIVDRAAIGHREPCEVAAHAIRGGADVIQLRDKAADGPQLIRAAEQLLSLTRAAGIPLMINDRADVAQAVGATGVHIGQDDLSVREARRLLGPSRVIGKSTHSLKQALAAETEGADYLGCGPIFPTPTKPDYESVGLPLIRQLMGAVRIPVVCIGGIDAVSLGQVLEAGAECVAVVRAVCAAANPESATRGLKDRIEQLFRSSACTRL